MCIMNFIKNYLCTIIFTLILASILSISLLIKQVEGASDCRCRTVQCTTKPTSSITCPNTTPCNCPQGTYTVCTYDWGERCISDSGGCCQQSDCASEHNGKGCNYCTGCVQRTPIGCTGVPNTCGICDFPPD